MGPSGHFYSFLSVCGPSMFGVKCWDRLPCYRDMLYFGRAPRTKETRPRFFVKSRVLEKGTQ